MALVRVYCGVATAEMAPWLTVAVVDDAGRLLDMRHISDDPAGYAYLGALLADRSGGAAPVAIDRHEHLLAQLLAAANRPVAIADEVSLADFAERFSDDTSYDEMQAPVSQRCAVGLARALQAGALYATAQSPSWDLDELKPVLAAHGAVTAGRQAAAVALREVLRELYPAALRAYPDPAEYVPLKILDALPEPGMVTASASNRNRDASLVAELSASGVADPTTAVNAITALRVAVEESPRWNANRLLASVVAETVRQTVAAVRACDSASAVLVATLVERLNAMQAGAMQASAMQSGAMQSGAMQASAMPTAGPNFSNAPMRPYLVHPAAAPGSPAVARRVPGPAAEVPPSRLSPRASTASAAAAGLPAAGPGVPAQRGAPTYSDPSFSGPTYSDPGYPGPGLPQSGYSAPGSRSEWPMRPVPDNDHVAVRESEFASAYVGTPTPGGLAHQGAEDAATTLSFAMDPLNAPLEPARALHEPPLRLVQPWSADPVTPFADRSAPPVLRVIDGGRQPSNADQPPDDDLLIFSQTHSAWFTQVDDPSLADDAAGWGRLANDGWRVAEQLAHPAVGAETTAGLPRRVPQANLVPGSAQQPQRQLRIVRDARSIAAHTEGYFRGWRRGQEIGGFAVGQRDRAAWEFNREQRARLS